tara:strand:- start:2100 stop:3203 length:1104 start_codon:yes stop_codon:yes gene_type:complete
MKINFYEHNIRKLNTNSVLNSLYLTSGPICKKVEKNITKRFKKKHCLLTNSWTNAVIGILKSLDLKKNDEVIIPSLTFVACANVVELSGAKVVFADVDPKTLLLSIDDCLKKITSKTKVIMPVHLYGNLFDTKKLKDKIRKKIKIIEDCAHTFYGKYSNNKILGHYADFSVFSFYATKNITCGEGGAIITNDKSIHLIKSILINGMSASAHNRFTGNKYNSWDVKKPGFKGNLSDINASLLLTQIPMENSNALKRKKIYEYFRKKLSNIVDVPLSTKFKKRDYHLFPIGLKNKEQRDKLLKELFLKKIPATVNYTAITKLDFYKKKYRTKCLVSEDWGDRTLSLPFHLKLTKKNIDFICKTILEFLS